MNKNEKLLAEFTAYCEQHPDMRFWQALTNWAGLPYLGWAASQTGKNFRDLWHAKGKNS